VISLKLSEASKKHLADMIARKVAEVTAKAASVVYNTAITYDGPVWSGTYRHSWDISVGSPSSNRIPHPTVSMGKPDVKYGELGIRLQEPQYSTPFRPIYVSNTADHAYKVENVGTPSHPDSGWKIAAHSKNQALAKFRKF